MKWTFNLSLVSRVLLVLLIGCSPKSGFYTSASKGSFGPEEHARAQSISHPADTPGADLPIEEVLADSVSFVAAASGRDTTVVVPIDRLSMAERVNLHTRWAEESISDEHVNITYVQKAANKKGIRKAASEHPVHKLSWLSFGLSMAGLVFLIIALSVSIPLLPFALSFLSFLAAIITGRNAISRIKKNPGQFSGKGLAQGGFIFSLIMLLLYVAFILYVLAFAGAF